MKNMVKCILCTLLLVALVILSSCTGRDDSRKGQSHAADTTVVLKDPVTDTSAHLRFPTNDSTSSKKELSRRSQKDMIRWATLGGM